MGVFVALVSCGEANETTEPAFLAQIGIAVVLEEAARAEKQRTRSATLLTWRDETGLMVLSKARHAALVR